jgi:hypothetical protein
VLGEVVAPRKRRVALGTHKRSLSRVTTDVPGEITALCKRLGTGGALERLLLGVRSDMNGPAIF